jgi:hypothetical protein
VLRPAEGDAWLAVAPTGTAAVPFRFEEGGGAATVQVGIQPDGPVPSLELALGTARPFDLLIESYGAGNSFELGGLPIRRLEARLSGGPTVLSFAAPNPVAMSRLHIEVGAGQMEGKQLCNAAFSELLVDGGSCSLRLEMTGELTQEATARVATSGGSTWMLVPESVPVEVSGHGLFGTPRVIGHFTRIADLYLNAAALAGERPQLKVQNSMAMGTFQVVSA